MNCCAACSHWLKRKDSVFGDCTVAEQMAGDRGRTPPSVLPVIMARNEGQDCAFFKAGRAVPPPAPPPAIQPPGRCQRCNGPLRSTNTIGFCQMTRLCRNEYARKAIRLKNERRLEQALASTNLCATMDDE